MPLLCDFEEWTNTEIIEHDKEYVMLCKQWDEDDKKWQEELKADCLR